MNSSVFRHLVNKTPLSRLCELEQIGPSTLYGKIDFIYRQCALFAASREARLPGMELGRRALCTDKQDYLVNWGSRDQRASIQLTAVATAEARSGYIFGFSLNYDSSMNSDDVEDLWKANGDADKPPHFRELARVWTHADYMASKERSRDRTRRHAPREGEYVDISGVTRSDLDVSEVVIEGQQLPKVGVQVHADYLTHGHYHVMRHLMRGASRLNCFVDAEAGMLSACIGAFSDRIASQMTDVVQLKINKTMTIDERRTAQSKVIKKRDGLKKLHPDLSVPEIKRKLLVQRVQDIRDNSPLPKHRLQNVWIEDPLPGGAEPEKLMRFVTDVDHLDADQVAALLCDATLWPLDTVFNMIRRRITMFERPVLSARRARRMWHIYAAYDPARAVQMLEIFRVWYNYLWRGKDGRTAAERLGLAYGTIRMDHILGYDLRKIVSQQFDA